jgi:predicted RecA/RadA family phage recombinase
MVDYTPGGNVASEAVVLQGDLIGIALRPISANVKGALATGGIFDFTKNEGVGEAIAAGAPCYWDVAEGMAKDDAESGANKLIGKCVAAAGDDDPTVRIKLDQ